jgi:hypothetical protein
MRVRYLVRRAVVAVVLLVITFGLGLGGYFAGKALFVHNRGGGGEAAGHEARAPAPEVIIRRPQVETASGGLSFPAAATKDTTRVGGADATADAADVALAVYPPARGVPGPDAATLVSGEDWRNGVAAASLAAPPVGAPVLIGAADGVPSITDDTLRSLAPAGSAATGGKQLLAVGGVAVPSGFKVTRAGGSGPAAVAAAVVRLRKRLTGADPAHIVIASLDDPAFAMPAASWAARSGDPVLFAGAGPPPVATLKALHHNAGVPVYVVGPPSAVSNRAFQVIRRVAPDVKRVAGGDPVANSIALARYASGNFGWGIDDPGHQLAIASATRPLDAAAGAALSSTGAWAPLLVTSSADRVPPELRDYLLDLKPGYVSDPTRALYNHAWLLGDPGAISVAAQARLDDLLSLVEVRSGATGGVPPPAKP